MERREQDAASGDASRGAAARDAEQQDAVRGVKREPAGQQVTAAATEENWSALSNLRVGEDAAQTQPGSTRPSGSNRHKVRRTSSYAHPTTPQDDAGAFSKSSLSFILDDQAASAAAAGGDDFTSGGKRAAALITRSRSTGDLAGEAAAGTAAGLGGVTAAHIGHSSRASGKQQGADGKRRARRPPSRICKHEGCEQYVVDQGLCVRHGGGKRCQTLGCTSRAKHQGRCWKHGGSTECKVPSCINRAKSRGFCWSHGGGTRCKADQCEKIAISNGLCWAHGGGKRCVVEGCKRQAYERTDNLCNNHYQERQRGGAVAASSGHPDDEEKPPAPPADQ